MTRLVRVGPVAPWPVSDERPSAYKVLLDSGRRIGLVVAERDDIDGAPGPRRWFASWREIGDQRPRWVGVAGHRTRRDAVAELLDVIARSLAEGRRGREN